MKKILLTFTILGAGISAFSQGWVSGASNSLYSVNSSLGLTPISIGIGVSSPSAQFHTSGTVRFAGLLQNDLLTRIMVTDANGNVSWRDASTLGSGSAWSLTGNASTNPTNNFLGTTDNQRLVFRTNNTEKMTVLTSGHVGIGVTNPQRTLHVNSTSGDNQVAVSGTTPSIRWFAGSDILASQYTKVGRIGVATGATDFVGTSVPGDFVIQNLDTTASLIFGTNQSGVGLERMRINKIGYVGISTTAPTAKLHVNCVAVAGQSNPSNIRFQNLPSGSGDYLVVDANGYVYTTPLARPGSSGDKNLEKKVAQLEKELKDLRDLIQSGNANQPERFFSVFPNPASQEVTVKKIGTQKVNGKIFIADMNGNPVTPKSMFIDSKTISLSTLSGGAYLVSLYGDDNKLIESQRIIVVR